MLFTRLSVLLGGGLSLLAALRLLALEKDEKTAALCRRLLTALGRGFSLHEAMALEPERFGSTAPVLVEAGEKSGQLPAVLGQLAAYYKEQARWKEALGQALLYPLFLLGASCLLLLFFLLYVLPALAKTYKAMGAKLSPDMMWALAAADGLTFYGLPLAAALAAAAVFLFSSERRKAKVAETLPFIKELRRQFSEERTCRLLALLLKSGIGLSEALDLAAGALGESGHRRGLAAFKWGLARGMSIEEGAELTGSLLSPLTKELLRAGVAGGSLTEMLEEAAALVGEELTARLQRCRELLAPCFLLVTALLIALVLCLMLRPLFSLFTLLPA